MADLRRVVEDFGGTVLQVMGDGVFAAFGIPAGHEDDAERAVRSAIAIRNRIRELHEAGSGFPLPEVHSGVNTGDVFAVRTGDPSGLSVLGDAVNVAARIGDLAPGGTILVGERTRELTMHVIRYGPRRRKRVKGKKDPLAIYEVLGASAQPPAGRPPVPSSATFVGREEVLKRLAAEMRTAEEDRRSRMLVVTGDPGIGKTRLSAEFRRRIGGTTVLVGRCAPYGQRAALAPLVAAVSEAAGVVPGQSREATEAAIGAFARRAAGGKAAEELGRRIHALLSIEEGGDRPGGSIEEAVAAARAIVEQLAAKSRVVIVLDDLHWADADLVQLLQDMQASPWKGAILLLGLSRPELPDGGLPAIALEALGDPDMRALLEATIGGSMPDPAARALVARAGGNPLFLEESLRMLIEAGAIAAKNGGWRVTAPERLELVPTSLRLLIAARLDGLDPDEKRALQDASVAGRVTWGGLIDRIHPEAVGVLDRLEGRDLLRRRPRSDVPGSIEFEFKHVLIRDVAYESLPRAERAVRHRQTAEWLEEVAPSLAEEPVAALAHHYEQSWLLAGGAADLSVAQRAVLHLKRWGDRAYARQAREAEAIYSRAVQIAAAVPEACGPSERTELLIARAESLVELGRHGEALVDAKAAHEAAVGAGIDELRARALLAQAGAESQIGEVERARERLDEALGLFQAAGDVRGETEALHRLSDAWRYDDYGREISYLERARERSIAAGDRSTQQKLSQELAFLLTVTGGDAFRRHFEDAVRLVEDQGDLRSRAAVLRTWSYHAYYRGDFADAVATAREGRPIAAEAGARIIETDLLLIEALATTWQAHPSKAERLALEALAAAEEIASRGFRALSLAATARPALRLGRPAEAEASLAESRRIYSELNIPVQMPGADLDEAELALDRGDWERCRPLAAGALAAFRASGWRLYQIWPLVVGGRASLGTRRLDDAVRDLDEAAEIARDLDALGMAALSGVAGEQARLLRGDAAAPTEPGGPPDARAIGAENAGIRALLAGDPPEAVAPFSDAIERWSRLGKTAWLARAHAFHAHALRFAGDKRAAAAATAQCSRVLDALDVPKASRPSIRAPLGS